MTRYAMLTHDPEPLLRAYGSRDGWSVIPFDSAVEALVWERRLRSDGAILLESRGWRFGVIFSLEADNERTAADAAPMRAELGR